MVGFQKKWVVVFVPGNNAPPPSRVSPSESMDPTQQEQNRIRPMTKEVESKQPNGSVPPRAENHSNLIGNG